MVEKSATAFRTIGEVADLYGVPQHILRFWEGKFPQLRPLQRAGNRRYYRPEDVALVARIQRLLDHEGYTIKGVQRLLADKPAAVEIETPRPQAPVLTASQRAQLLGVRELLLDGLERSAG